jgi:putative flippase GtrA
VKDNFLKLKPLFPRLVKYFFVGLFCALIDWGIFYLLVYKLNFSYLLAGTLAFLISGTINYFLCRLVFISKGRKKIIEYIMLLIASSIALSIDLGTMYLLIEFFTISQILSKIIGTGMAFMFNYCFRQFIIFSPE